MLSVLMTVLIVVVSVPASSEQDGSNGADTLGRHYERLAQLHSATEMGRIPDIVVPLSHEYLRNPDYHRPWIQYDSAGNVIVLIRGGDNSGWQLYWYWYGLWQYLPYPLLTELWDWRIGTEGALVDEDSGPPVTGAKVVYLSNTASLTRRGTGAFCLSDLRGGTFAVTGSGSTSCNLRLRDVPYGYNCERSEYLYKKQGKAASSSFRKER